MLIVSPALVLFVFFAIPRSFSAAASEESWWPVLPFRPSFTPFIAFGAQALSSASLSPLPYPFSAVLPYQSTFIRRSSSRPLLLSVSPLAQSPLYCSLLVIPFFLVLHPRGLWRCLLLRSP